MSAEMMDVALRCVERGWSVFPCKPKTKEPLIHGGFKSASNDREQVAKWWTAHPTANVGVATGASGLTVLDIDHGLDGVDDVAAYCAKAGLPKTYAVRTGRRPGFGVQLYFQGEGVRSIPWKDESLGVDGDVRGASGYVMAEGSHHPSGAFYEALIEAPIAPVPNYVMALKRPAALERALSSDAVISEWRNDAMARILGKARSAGLSDEVIRAHALKENERMSPPLGEEELDHIIDSICRYPKGEPDPEVIIGKPKEARESETRERPRFLTLEDFDNTKPPEFLIENFLVKEAMCMLAGPVAQRKTIVAMNVVKALCTGEPLFGHFKVERKPSRIFYLCPEMGASSFCKRMKGLGVRDYIGKTLFCLTLNQPQIDLEDLEGEDVSDSVIVIDTLTRYVNGKESDSTDMRIFAARVMAINRRGATILLLHHSVKGSSGNLDGALRGSSELAAFVTSCWVTGLEDTDDPYKSRSSMANVKQRDFESEAFALAPVADSYLLVYDGVTGPRVQVAKRADMTSKAELAAAVLYDANPNITPHAMRLALKEGGNGKGSDWVAKTLMALRESGTRRTEAHSLTDP